MVVILSLLCGPATARVNDWGWTKADFFDWPYIVGIWKNEKDARKLKKIVQDHCHNMNVSSDWFREWRAEFEKHHMRPAALQRLARQPGREHIKKCYDLFRMWKRWQSIMEIYGLAVGFRKRAAPLNQITDQGLCNKLAGMNMFTRDCNDIPDWRTEEQRQQHNAAVARALGQE